MAHSSLVDVFITWYFCQVFYKQEPKQRTDSQSIKYRWFAIPLLGAKYVPLLCFRVFLALLLKGDGLAHMIQLQQVAMVPWPHSHPLHIDVTHSLTISSLPFCCPSSL